METVEEILLASIVQQMVDHPSDVRVVRTSDEIGTLLSLHVNPNDMGKVIGIQGATANALRLIFRNIGIRQGIRMQMKIVEPKGSTHPQALPKKELTPLDDLDKHLDL